MITPMVTRLVRDPFDREGWLFELKWDGFRCIAEKDRQGVRLYSRNRNDFKKRFPAIAEQISALDNVILDGEVCATRRSRPPAFRMAHQPGTAARKARVLRVKPAVASQVYGVAAIEPWVLAASAALIGFLAVTAIALPAFRASRVNPNQGARDY